MSTDQTAASDAGLGAIPSATGEADTIAQALLLASEKKIQEALSKLVGQSFSPTWEPTALVLRAQLLEGSDPGQAHSLYTQAISKYPTHPEIPLRAGIFAYRRGDLVKAETLLRQSWSIGSLPETAYYLGKINAASDRVGVATEFFLKAAAMEGSDGKWRGEALSALRALPRG